MILRRNLLQYNNGFSLIEVVVTVLVIGILSAVGFPLYHYLSNRYEQTEVDSTALVIQNEFMTTLSDTTNTTNFKYPLAGKKASDNSTVDYFNITDSEMINLCVVLFNLSPKLKDNEIIQTKSIQKGSFSNQQAEVVVTILFKSGNQIVFNFKYLDNPYNYVDTASLSNFTYISKNGVFKTLPLS